MKLLTTPKNNKSIVIDCNAPSRKSNPDGSRISKQLNLENPGNITPISFTHSEENMILGLDLGQKLEAGKRTDTNVKGLIESKSIKVKSNALVQTYSKYHKNRYNLYDDSNVTNTNNYDNKSKVPFDCSISPISSVHNTISVFNDAVVNSHVLYPKTSSPINLSMMNAVDDIDNYNLSSSDSNARHNYDVISRRRVNYNKQKLDTNKGPIKAVSLDNLQPQTSQNKPNYNDIVKQQQIEIAKAKAAYKTQKKQAKEKAWEAFKLDQQNKNLAEAKDRVKNAKDLSSLFGKKDITIDPFEYLNNKSKKNSINLNKCMKSSSNSSNSDSSDSDDDYKSKKNRHKHKARRKSSSSSSSSEDDYKSRKHDKYKYDKHKKHSSNIRHSNSKSDLTSLLAKNMILEKIPELKGSENYYNVANFFKKFSMYTDGLNDRESINFNAKM